MLLEQPFSAGVTLPPGDGDGQRHFRSPHPWGCIRAGGVCCPALCNVQAPRSALKDPHPVDSAGLFPWVPLKSPWVLLEISVGVAHPREDGCGPSSCPPRPAPTSSPGVLQPEPSSLGSSPFKVHKVESLCPQACLLHGLPEFSFLCWPFVLEPRAVVQTAGLAFPATSPAPRRA